MRDKYAISIIFIVILLFSLLSAQEMLPEIEVICLSYHLYKLLIGPVSVVVSIGQEGVLLSDTGFESTGRLFNEGLAHRKQKWKELPNINIVKENFI